MEILDLFGQPARNVSVTGLKDGGYVIFWEEWEEATGGPGTRVGVFASRCDASGTLVDQSILLDTSRVGYQHNHTAVALDNGKFVVAWNTDDDRNGKTDIAVQLFGDNQAAIGAVSITGEAIEGGILAADISLVGDLDRLWSVSRSIEFTGPGERVVLGKRCLARSGE